MKLLSDSFVWKTVSSELSRVFMVLGLEDHRLVENC